MTRRRVQFKKAQVCIGDLRHRVTLFDRDLTEPQFGKTDFDESFTNPVNVHAAVKTLAGKVFFDGVGDVALTHEIVIRFRKGVTSEKWVTFESRRLKVVDVEDIDEDHKYLRLRCTERGADTVEAAKA